MRKGPTGAGDTGTTGYSALLDFRELGSAVKKLAEIFEGINSWLPQLIHEVEETRKDIDASILLLHTSIPISAREAASQFSEEVSGLQPPGPAGHRAVPVLWDEGGELEHDRLLGGQLGDACARHDSQDDALVAQDGVRAARQACTARACGAFPWDARETSLGLVG